MPLYEYAIPAVLVAGVAVIASHSRRRSHAHLIKAVNPELAFRLMPYTGMADSPRYLDKEELWRAMGGAAGIWGICRAAGAIATLSLRIAEDHPEARTAATEAFVSANYLRMVAMMCVVEAGFCSVLPMLPRMIAWTLARHYCDLVSSLNAANDLAAVSDNCIYS